MRGDLIPAAVDVHPDHGLRVDGVALIRVDDHTEEARVGLQACNFLKFPFLSNDLIVFLNFLYCIKM